MRPCWTSFHPIKQLQVLKAAVVVSLLFSALCKWQRKMKQHSFLLSNCFFDVRGFWWQQLWKWRCARGYWWWGICFHAIWVSDHLKAELEPGNDKARLDCMRSQRDNGRENRMQKCRSSLESFGLWLLWLEKHPIHCRTVEVYVQCTHLCAGVSIILTDGFDGWQFMESYSSLRVRCYCIMMKYNRLCWNIWKKILYSLHKKVKSIFY